MERKLFGGTCVNTGCIPAKSMVASSYAAHMVRRAADFGVVNNGSASTQPLNDAELVSANLLDNDARKVRDRITAYAVYIDPPLGRVGLMEAEVRKCGRQALTGRRPVTKVGRAGEKGETQGFMKIIVDALGPTKS